MMLLSLYLSVLLIMVTARLISTLVVGDEATDWPFVSQARQTPPPHPFWPPPPCRATFFYILIQPLTTYIAPVIQS